MVAAVFGVFDVIVVVLHGQVLLLTETCLWM